MLKEKQHLRELYLEWSTEGDVNDWDVVDDKMPLEGFEPLPNLKRLELHFLSGFKASELGFFINKSCGIVAT
jgi:hypothetical protein